VLPGHGCEEQKAIREKPRALCAAVLIGLAVSAAPARAAEEIEEKPGEYCGICEAKKRLHEMAPWLQAGGDLRIRGIYQTARRLDKHAADDERAWARYRARLWATLTPADDLDLNLRLAMEPRYFFQPRTMEEQSIREELLLDQLNVKWSNAFDLPMTIKAGRQDMELGDGWLVVRGTPRDGSRTNFFDALRITLDAKQCDTTIDLVGLRNHSNSSWMHRPFNDRDVLLSEQDETGAILYVSNTSLPETTIDGYFIYKHDDRVEADGNNADIYTFGCRVAGAPGEHWRYHAELAPQFGHKNGTNICALGFNGQVEYAFGDDLDNRLHAGYEYRSGDDDPDGAFDILWARVAQWSDVFTGEIDVLEGQSHRSANLHRLHYGWGCKPARNVDLMVNHQLLFADRNPFGGMAGFTDDGGFRGHLLAAIAKQTLGEHVKHHLKGEVFLPGDYYDNTRNDVALWMRYEIVFSW